MIIVVVVVIFNLGTIDLFQDILQVLHVLEKKFY